MGSKKILIIDDNPDFLFTMETFLKRSGFTTLTAQDGKNGVEIAEAS
jgi:DNA-binding response OmpR family regulator